MIINVSIIRTKGVYSIPKSFALYNNEKYFVKKKKNNEKYFTINFLKLVSLFFSKEKLVLVFVK